MEGTANFLCERHAGAAVDDERSHCSRFISNLAVGQKRDVMIGDDDIMDGNFIGIIDRQMGAAEAMRDGQIPGDLRYVTRFADDDLIVPTVAANGQGPRDVLYV